MSIPRSSAVMEHVDDELISEAAEYRRTRKKNAWAKWAAAAACLCLVAAGAAALLPKTVIEKAAGTELGGEAPIPGGIAEGLMYSVAVLPAGRGLDDVRNACCVEVSQEEARNEAGLCDYLPSALPDAYHFGRASLYTTTLKDGTVCRLLRVDYITGEGSADFTDGDGAAFAQISDDPGSEFRISVFDFKPDTSCGIYTPEEIRDVILNGDPGNGLFYVRYGDHYVGIEPLSLGTEELLRLIDGIGP